MTEPQHNTITAPGISATIRKRGSTAESAAQVTTSSVLIPFDAVKHLFSDKPLRRPNRTKPIGRGKRKKKRRR